MFRQDDDSPDPQLPRWLVPWVYPIGLGLAGVVLVALLVGGAIRLS